jgi:2,4-dienoyl-CoA reductase-like NADH-dependent reductase (Old Yellow Enzyme family)
MAGPDGSVTPLLMDTMVALAKGGVGLIVSGIAYAQKEG